LLVYRAIDDEVNFIQIPPITFRLLQILQQNKAISCQDCLSQIAKESAHPEPDRLMLAGQQIISDLAKKHIIVASKSS